MSYIVILVANPQAGPLTPHSAMHAKDFCGGQHLTWLAPEVAAEFIVKKLPDISQLKLVLGHKATDVFITRFRGRRKNTIRTAKAAVDRSMQYAYRDR
ncbi:MAG: hypothetical protein B7Z81_02100, partial [Acidocella sp. 20-61-6]